MLRIKENITWYSARGSFISKMVDAGNNPYVVAEMAGNSPLTIYKHYYKNTKREEIKRLLKVIDYQCDIYYIDRIALILDYFHYLCSQ